MGKDAKSKDSGAKGKGKQAAGAADENTSKGNGKGGKAADGLGTCTFFKFFFFFFFFLLNCPLCHIEEFFFLLIITSFCCFSFLSKSLLSRLLFWPLICSARHILCEKQGKINEAYKKLQDGWLGNGDKVPPAEFAKVNLYLGYYHSGSFLFNFFP
jgi:NIMA-interacting peptidyl-prolyl cis-trans isomerase 4